MRQAAKLRPPLLSDQRFSECEHVNSRAAAGPIPPIRISTVLSYRYLLVATKHGPFIMNPLRILTYKIILLLKLINYKSPPLNINHK
eukprot:COSAG01_NODE_20462_length_952_cov_1.101993_1_plen_87_part_00